jgi:glycosyltransferase involved in cell wall biosynthesis
MRITVLASNVSENALGRALLLAEVLARDFEVQLLGTRFGDGVWAPARPSRIEVESLAGRYLPGYAATIGRLVRAIRGDVVYAVKPLLPSLGVALLRRRLRGTPVVVDIDDDELAFRPRGTLARPRGLVASLAHPNGRAAAAWALRRVREADGVTVATEVLRARHGGALVPHARDTDRVLPRPDLRERARERLGAGERRLIVFVGTPRPHKGIEETADAARRSRARPAFAVVGADPSDPYVGDLAARYPELILHPPTSLEDGAFLLQGADAVVIAQRDEPAGAAQLPAKLIDAMALAKPVLATAVSDIPAILGDGRGWVVPAGDADALTAALDALLADPEEAARRGAGARAWCVANASHASAAVTLRAVFDPLLRPGRAR